MGMQVNTNIAANNAYRNLATTQNDLSKSLEKLSSGLRINRAADDAAGLAISEGLKSQVGGLTVASRNAQDAISVLQTAEGSLNEVTSILQRMRDLAVQAGNDSNNAQSREAITVEVDALVLELGRIGTSSNFNGQQLLDGTANLDFQIGADQGDSINVDLGTANIVDLATDLNTGTAAITFKSTVTAGAANLKFTVGTNTVQTGMKAGSGDSSEDIAAALNADANFVGGSLKATVVDGFVAVRSTAGQTVQMTADVGIAAGSGIAAGGLDFMSSTTAGSAINTIDGFITEVSETRALIGANQNRFESVIKNLAVSKENLTAAGSRIRDTDRAEEMVKYTRANILSQAGTAMLAQANQSNSGVLQLLQ